MDIGVKCTQDMYDLALQTGARKIAKRIAFNLGIKEEHQTSGKEDNLLNQGIPNNLDGTACSFKYDVSADAKV